MNKPSPLDWTRLRREKEAEVESLRGLRLSEVTPSRRDLTSFLGRGREEVSAIAVLRRRDPWSGEVWEDLDVAAAAAALDDADIAALGVSTDPLFHGGRVEDLGLAAAAATAPILRDELLVHPLQVFHSRMLGADACIAAAAWMSPEALTELTRTASSLHMTAMLAVFTPEDLARVRPFERNPLAVWALDENGAVERERLQKIVELVPRQQSIVLLGDLIPPASVSALRGLVDGVLVARALRQADPGAGLAALLEEGA